MENIGLLGDAFDPAYNDHLRIARTFADETDLDTVVFLPAGDPYHKPQTMQTSAARRLAMIELAAAEDVHFAVSDCDIVCGGATCTLDAVQVLRRQSPTARLWRLLDSDSLMELHTWKKQQALIKQTHIAVAVRKGDGLGQTSCELHTWLGEMLQNGSVKILQAPLYDISSTRIRQNVRNSSLPGGLTPPQMARYIHEHGPYH